MTGRAQTSAKAAVTLTLTLSGPDHTNI